MTSSLIPRLEAGNGSDRELDALIVAHFNNAIVKRYPPTDDFGPRNKWQFWSKDSAHFLGSESKYPVPEYTSSLDASLALVERMLPGSDWSVECNSGAPIERAHRACIWGYGWQYSPTAPRALLIALLKALESSK